MLTFQSALRVDRSATNRVRGPPSLRARAGRRPCLVLPGLGARSWPVPPTRMPRAAVTIAAAEAAAAGAGPCRKAAQMRQCREMHPGQLPPRTHSTSSRATPPPAGRVPSKPRPRQQRWMVGAKGQAKRSVTGRLLLALLPPPRHAGRTTRAAAEAAAAVSAVAPAATARTTATTPAPPAPRPQLPATAAPAPAAAQPAPAPRLITRSNRHCCRPWSRNSSSLR